MAPMIGCARRADTTFQRCNPFFEDGIGRIGDARVDMTGSLDIKQRRSVVWTLEDVRSGLVDRRGTGASSRVGPLTGVQGQGVKTERFRLAHGVLRDRHSIGREQSPVFWLG